MEPLDNFLLLNSKTFLVKIEANQPGISNAVIKKEKESIKNYSEGRDAINSSGVKASLILKSPILVRLKATK